MRARHYAPERGDGAPLLVFLHGGGFVFGDLDTHDAPCRVLARHGGMHVLAVEYRLAPEHPFPAAVDDARAALRWAHEHASELGADPARVGIGGDSAGANLSAAVTLLATHDGGPAPACQMLVYPAVDRTRPYPSIELFADGFFLTRASIEWFHRQYSGKPGIHDRDPRLGPLHAETLAGLPPALVVTAGFDPLRDEGEAYAAALQAAGTTTVLRRFDSLIHGFFNMVGVSPACRDAVIEIAGATRALFAIGAARATRPSSTARSSATGVSAS
jgi:acetyl esterase